MLIVEKFAKLRLFHVACQLSENIFHFHEASVNIHKLNTFFDVFNPNEPSGALKQPTFFSKF